ncbi:MAG: DUF1861 family protein [Saccharofermentanales bacterium]
MSNSRHARAGISCTEIRATLQRRSESEFCQIARFNKKPLRADRTFTSGIVMRDDGYADLFSGIGDATEGRTVMPYPFQGRGKIISKG